MPRAIRPLLLVSYLLLFAGTALLAMAQKEGTSKPDPEEEYLEKMKKAGYDTSKPYKLYFRLVIEAQCENHVVSRLREAGFDVVRPLSRITYVLEAHKAMVPRLASLQKIRRYLDSLVKSRCGPGPTGSYTEWGFEPGGHGAYPAPTDLCSLLPAAEASKIAGQAYDSPSKSLDRSVLLQETCTYRSQEGSQIFLNANVNPSRFLAVHRFAERTAFFRGGGRHGVASDLKGIGEEAYWDEAHALLVRKGRVFFYISFVSTAGFIDPADNFAKEKQLIELARAIAHRTENSGSGKQEQN